MRTSDLFGLQLLSTDPPVNIDVSPPALSVERTGQLLGLSEEEAIDVLVCLRTLLHNVYLVPSAATAPSTQVANDDQAMAMVMLMNMLDDIDAVYLRLDSRVADGVPEPVPVEPQDVEEMRLITEAAALSAHEAAWNILRPECRPNESTGVPGADVGVQKQLLLPFDSRSAVEATPKRSNELSAKGSRFRKQWPRRRAFAAFRTLTPEEQAKQVSAFLEVCLPPKMTRPRRQGSGHVAGRGSEH